jgi:hypothetical protein
MTDHAEPGPAQAPLGSRPVFAGHSHAGWFVATSVVQTPARRESHVPGIFVVPYQVTLEAREILPAVNRRSFVITGARGEGREAGALGLQDWLPTRVGEELVLALDANRAGPADQIEFLGGGPRSAEIWQSVRRFAATLGPDLRVEAPRLAAMIGQPPPPGLVFFRLVVQQDRGAFGDPEVMRAMGGYLGNDAAPAMERRNVVAHYMGAPDPAQTHPLRELAGGMVRLIARLGQEGQATSADVAFQRLWAWMFDPATQAPRVTAPDIGGTSRDEAARMAVSAGLSPEARDALGEWLGSR